MLLDDLGLDQLLSDTASINEQIKNVIDGHTEPWGTQVTAVEIKDITPKEAEAGARASGRRSWPLKGNTKPQ